MSLRQIQRSRSLAPRIAARWQGGGCEVLMAVCIGRPEAASWCCQVFTAYPFSRRSGQPCIPKGRDYPADERLACVSGETTRQDLVLLRQILDAARREWG